MSALRMQAIGEAEGASCLLAPPPDSPTKSRCRPPLLAVAAS